MPFFLFASHTECNVNDSQLTIKQIIDKYNLLSNRGRSKAFGQHFICDLSLLRKIVSFSAPDQHAHRDIVEIGPGPAGLTRAIIEKLPNSSHLFCIEKDVNMAKVHENLAMCYEPSVRSRLHFIYADALDIELHKLTSRKIIIISNLPYNISTTLLINWFHNDIGFIDTMTLMFQKEVASRIVASTGTKAYGRLSVISQTLCNCRKLFDISNMAFHPPPKVLSTVLQLKPRENIENTNIASLETLTNMCFQRRRKTMFSILKNKLANASELLAVCQIDMNDRPENVSPEQFVKLCERIPQ
jgi:16S rRNA (adenine1518-N6/adenine1519-N6)-dimethyltransferase